MLKCSAAQVLTQKGYLAYWVLKKWIVSCHTYKPTFSQFIMFILENTILIFVGHQKHFLYGAVLIMLLSEPDIWIVLSFLSSKTLSSINIVWKHQLAIQIRFYLPIKMLQLVAGAFGEEFIMHWPPAPVSSPKLHGRLQLNQTIYSQTC
jgi:hypothetical protein